MSETPTQTESAEVPANNYANGKETGASHATNHPSDVPLVDRMIRRPTDADFKDVLTPEGDSGSILGSGIVDSPFISNDSLGGTG